MLNKKFPVSLIILSIFILAAVSAGFYFFKQKRNESVMYVTVSLLKPENTIQNAPYNWVPYWITNSIDTGDREVSPLGIVSAEVIDKEIFDGPSSGQYVYLTLKTIVNRDRNGIYLYKNKPLLTGGEMELKLTKTQVVGQVLYINRDLPKYEPKKFIITVKGREIEPWVAEGLKEGGTILNKKGEVIAKLLDKKVTYAEVRSDWAGTARISYDNRKRDLEVTSEITAQKISDNYYFAVGYKVKTNEWIYLPFKDVSLFYPIISISEEK